MSARARAVPGPILTRGFLGLAAVAGLGGLLMLWRFISGLGATTAMNDGHPWGLWIAFDVVTGTALAAGGYSVALLVYVLNRGEYSRLIRPAILTTTLGYTIAAVSVVLDVGRYWNLWKVPISFRNWNTGSALLEVALCIMLYVMVLWVEVDEAVMEKWESSSNRYLKWFAVEFHPWLEKVLPFLIALGMLLPTMHQSSLGSIALVFVKLHPLWHSPLLPLLFLVSCIGMGYAGVVLESTLSSKAFRRPGEWKMLSHLSGVMAWVLAAYVVIRLGDLAIRKGPTMGLAADGPTADFLVELALFVAPAVILASKRRRDNPGWVFFAAILCAVAGALYRMNVYIIQFNPGKTWSYFPSLTEILITAGLVAAEIAAYVFIVKRFPILEGSAKQLAREVHS